jgi:hypothetical protein
MRRSSHLEPVPASTTEGVATSRPRLLDEMRARLRYVKDNGMPAFYSPDFLVRTADAVYLSETKAQDQTSHPNVQRKRKAAATWCERINALPPDLRSGLALHADRGIDLPRLAAKRRAAWRSAALLQSAHGTDDAVARRPGAGQLSPSASRMIHAE